MTVNSDLLEKALLAMRGRSRADTRFIILPIASVLPNYIFLITATSSSGLA